MVKSQQNGIELVTRPADLQKLEADRAKDKKRVDKLLTAFNDSDEEATAEETEKKTEASGSVAAIKPFSLAPQAESKDLSSEEKKAATPGFSFGAPKSDPKPKSTETADPAPKGPDVTANTGSKDEKKDDKPPPPAFSFGASALASSASTAKPEDKKEGEGTAVASKPQFSFGTSAVSPKPKDPLSSAAAATTSIPAKPSFAFGSSGGSTTSRSGH